MAKNSLSWITLYPDCYLRERQQVQKRYPDFTADQRSLAEGTLLYWGQLRVRPTGGTLTRPVSLLYPQGFPFETPIVIPLRSLPPLDAEGATSRADPRLYDYRHQMPDGNLCLFQRETRTDPELGHISGVAALRRAERWFLGLATGHWPPDSAESELQAHFKYAGDVLLSNVFYSGNLSGGGRFFMVPDLRRRMESQHRDGCPRIVTAITHSSGGLEAVLDARQDISRIYPWITDDAFSPLTIATIDASERVDDHLPLDVGYWWALEKEPEPFHDGAGLLKTLSRVAPQGDSWALVSGAMKSDLTLADQHFLALRYPSRSGNPEWLVLYMPRARKATPGITLVRNIGPKSNRQMQDIDLGKTDAEKRREFESSRVGCMRAHAARPSDLRLRNTGVIKEGIEKKTVALIGLGALGSTVSELLAKAGVGTFRLCDLDRLATGNVARHVAGLHEFGARKTRVVASRLLEINPYVQISHILEGSAVASLSLLAEFMQPADLTITTTADEGVESVINQIAVLNRSTALYGRALRRADVGRVFLVRPGIDACKACLGLYSRQMSTGKPVPEDWIYVEERPTDILLHECGRPVIPASAADLTFIAALITRVALDVLQGHPIQANHFLWSRPGSPDIDPRVAAPMTTFAGTLRPSPSCPACREPDVTAVVMTEDVRKTIVSLAESTPKTETGGILIGFVHDGRRATVLKATEPGPNATRSSGLFIRDTEFTQNELIQAAREWGPKGMYLGEWHSHLEPEPIASHLDIDSMVGIARAGHYLTRCPVMVIAGVNPASGKVASLRSWSVPVGGRVYAVENSCISDLD